MNKNILRWSFLITFPLASLPVFAATPIDLSHQPISTLRSFTSTPSLSHQQGEQRLEEVSRSVDFNRTVHVRMKETYSGYPVWGADAIVHIPEGLKTTTSFSSLVRTAENKQGSMDGIIYQQLHTDLANSATSLLTKEQTQKALKHTLDLHTQKTRLQGEATDEKIHLIVYVDTNNKAHWAYHISFYAPVGQVKLPSKPVYIIDATSFYVYKNWDDIQTAALIDAKGGGFGGNQRAGKLIYDGLENHLASLNIKRDPETNTCFIQNTDVTVKRCTRFDYARFVCRQSSDISHACGSPDPEHNHVYWSGEFDAINGGYSPANDALFNGNIVKELYKTWYGMNVLENNGQASLLTMMTHIANFDNAFWDGEKMNFGDGYQDFYPLTSLGVTAHEISHGFTQQHANLIYDEESGAINESFSDMAAQAAEVFVYGKNTWMIGEEIFKAEGQALRYMDIPNKDCKQGKPCSINHVKDYYPGLNVHYSSGIYNRFFYLLATSPDWNVKKAFDVMVATNAHYWTSTTNFERGACAVIKAATIDYNYDTKAVKKAFAEVGIDTSLC
jgi:pseudolysin